MDKQKLEATVTEIFSKNLADLKAGKNIEMAFYLFFADGYWKVPGDHLEKPALYAYVNVLVDAFKPEAFCLASDTFVRDPATMDVMYEQLLACVVEPDGPGMSIMKPYERLPSGKIKLTKPQHTMEGANMMGPIHSLYQPAPNPFPNEAFKKAFLERQKQIIDEQKVAYKEVAPTAEKPEADAKGKSRHAADDGPTFH
jgi:hypothetical protein